MLSRDCPSTLLILSAAKEDLTSEKGHVGETGNNFPRGNESGVAVMWGCTLSVPVKQSILSEAWESGRGCDTQVLRQRGGQDRCYQGHKGLPPIVGGSPNNSNDNLKN